MTLFDRQNRQISFNERQAICHWSTLDPGYSIGEDLPTWQDDSLWYLYGPIGTAEFSGRQHRSRLTRLQLRQHPSRDDYSPWR